MAATRRYRCRPGAPADRRQAGLVNVGICARARRWFDSLAKLQWLQVARCAEHDDRRILLVLWRCRHLLLGQFKRDAVALVGDAPEMQRVPVDDDLSAADTEKAAEIDH